MLAGENGDDFPRMPEAENPNNIGMTASTLVKAIGNTIFATGNDELRPAMTGVLFQLDKDGATFVATDAQTS